MKLPVFATVAIGLVALTFTGCASSGIPEKDPDGLTGGFKTYAFIAGPLQKTINPLQQSDLDGDKNIKALTGEFGLERYSSSQSTASLPPATLTIRFAYASSNVEITTSTAKRAEIDLTTSLTGKPGKNGVFKYLINPAVVYKVGANQSIRASIVYDDAWDGTPNEPSFFTSDTSTVPIPEGQSIPITTFVTPANG